MTMAAACLPFVAALCLARILTRDRCAWGVALPVAIGVTAGASSVMFWLLLIAPIESRAHLVAIDAIGWMGVTTILAWRTFARDASFSADRTAASVSASDARRVPVDVWLAAGLALAFAGVAVVRVAASAATLPHGEWDAWAMWNARARAIAIGYPSAWHAAVRAMPHPDYPLLVPVFIARLWIELGRDTVAVPMATAAAFGAATVIVAACSVGQRHGAARGWLTAAILLASPTFLTVVVSQYADVPLAFYWLAAFVACDQAMRSRRSIWWAMAGATLALAAWTKNEGIAMLALAGVTMGVYAIGSRAPGRAARVTWLVAGALPAIVAVASFRYLMPGPSYLFSHLSLADVIARVRSLARWRTVAAAMGREIWLGGATYIGILPLTVVIAITLGHPRHWPRAAVAAVICTAGMLAVDASVYLLLSPNLVWHLSTSVDRVIVQLTPAIVWALLMLAGRSGDLD